MISVGIYTGDLDRFGLTGPNVYLIKLIKFMRMHEDIQLHLIHHQKTLNPIYKSTEDILIPRWPLLGELFLRSYDIDIVHFNYIPWNYRTFFPLLGSRNVATSHISIGWTEWKPYPVERWLQPFTAKFLDKIIAVSNDLKKRLLKFLHVRESKMKVIYSGVDHEIFRPLAEPDLARVKSKYSLKSRFILHVSNFSERKNPRTLLHTFDSIIKEGFEGELLIVGAHWKNYFSQNLIQAFGIYNKVRIMGYVPINELVALYNLAELAFFPSYHENFCFPTVEAMASGTPVVASNAFSIPEIVGNSAILCEPNDSVGFTKAIKAVLENESLREQMRKRGINNARRFSWEKCTQETIEVYKKVLNK
jgi:glycosyltransferase involved in cell wall biosynthesis